ncbi:MAG: helix-turn-helix transcriptional regulator [Colwellia sp.]|nr:helix-turn-helix transcriptional regulator [Colwellia sp.]
MFENIVLVVFFSHLLVATFLCSLSTGNRLSHKLLATYLLVVVIDLSDVIFSDFYRAYLDFDILRFNFSLFTGPTLYLYVKAAIYDDFKLKIKHLVHAIPYVIAGLVMVPNFFSVDNAAKQLVYDNFTNVPEITFIHFMTFIQLGFYLLVIYKHLIRYRKIVVENYSDADRLNRSWLTQLIYLFTLSYVIGLGRMYFRFSELYMYERLVLTILIISALLSICWILWQALHKPTLFSGVSSTIEVIDEQASVTKPTSDSKFSAIETEKYDAIVLRLRDYMQQNKPFLDPSLSLETLAKQINLPRNEVSLSINKIIGQHFFDFVNSYRINFAAKMLITNDGQPQKTVLEILYEVGFNSKSSFNSAFKKHLLMTPSQYRKLHS